MFPYALTNQEKPAEPLYQHKNTTTLYPSASSLATIAALITIHALQAIRESEKVNDEHKRLQYHPQKQRISIADSNESLNYIAEHIYGS